MNWTLLSIILAIVFFTSTIILTRRLTKKKKPAWAHETTKIIGLGSDAPPELKLSFAMKPISDVYRTIFIYFNRGNETITKAHVTETIAIHFEGADILRKPTILATSKKANKVTVGQSTKDGDNVIALQFFYLDHNDGVLVEVLHTASQNIRCSGNIMGTDKIEDMGKFIPPSSKRFFRRIGPVIVIVSIFLVFILFFVMRYGFGILFSPVWEVVAGVLGGVGIGALTGEVFWRTLQSMKFPAWAILTKTP
ncbi:MAG: hypothetical protein ACTSPB_07145 [Candidatus Thorarchaeota archaeon]